MFWNMNEDSCKDYGNVTWRWFQSLDDLWIHRVYADKMYNTFVRHNN